MDWIKKNYDQFLLLIVSLALLALSIILITRAQAFTDTFDGIRGDVSKSSEIQPLDVGRVEAAQERVAKPSTWDPTGKGSLFVSRKYIVKDESLVDPTAEGSIIINPPVPNEWFTQHELDILAPGILEEDPDADQFTNLDEWTGADPAAPGSKSTDPRDPKSHPPYITKLRLKQVIREAFRLVVQTYDGDPAKPESLTFQVNTLDVRQASQFLKIGEDIAGTKFKITGFEQKKAVDPATDFERDVSEITVQNTETGQDVVLVLQQITNSPDSFALFSYLWDNSEFRVKKDGNFTLPPENDVEYKLIDIADVSAQIQNLKTQEKHTLPLVQAQP